MSDMAIDEERTKRLSKRKERRSLVENSGHLHSKIAIQETSSKSQTSIYRSDYHKQSHYQRNGEKITCVKKSVQLMKVKIKKNIPKGSLPIVSAANYIYPEKNVIRDELPVISAPPISTGSSETQAVEEQRNFEMKSNTKCSVEHAGERRNFEMKHDNECSVEHREERRNFEMKSDNECSVEHREERSNFEMKSDHQCSDHSEFTGLRDDEVIRRGKKRKMSEAGGSEEDKISNFPKCFPLPYFSVDRILHGKKPTRIKKLCYPINKKVGKLYLNRNKKSKSNHKPSIKNRKRVIIESSSDEEAAASLPETSVSEPIITALFEQQTAASLSQTSFSKPTAVGLSKTKAIPEWIALLYGEEVENNMLNYISSWHMQYVKIGTATYYTNVHLEFKKNNVIDYITID